MGKAGDHLVRAGGYLVVLAIFIPVIGFVLLVGYFAASPKNNLWHADGGWFLFVVAAGLFVLMLWILTRIAATKNDSGGHM
jgi:hypothetical protein